MASVGDLLSNLGGVLDQQFLTGENKNRSLDIVQDGHTQRYGKLGDFAKQVDTTAERSYTEEGAFRTNYYNYTPKQRDILLQDPDITVLVKKRAFGSLAENYRPDLMDKQEALFLRATKVLFQNKCAQISAYEKLSKIARISTDIGRVDYNLLPILFSATDTLTQIPGVGDALSGFKNIVDRVREVVALSQDNKTTTWITNVPDSLRSTFGEGTGVIELTNIMSLSTRTSLKFAQGNFRLQLSDPYNIMLVTNLDIEQAISDAANKFYQNSFIQLGLSSLDEVISDKKRQLILARIGRSANPITFIVSPNTVFSKRVRAIIDNIGFEIIFDGSAIGNLTGSASVDPSAKFGSDAIGQDGLTDSEISIFNDIVSSIFTGLSLAETTRRQAKFDNQDPNSNLNSVRKKMRLHYGGKLIIQPMDTVHIYIDSKKKIDSKIIGGLQNSFSSLGFLQGVNNVTRDLKDLFNVFNGYSLEKSIFIGDDFPNWLWLAMRSLFVADKGGAHVFAGIVENSSSTYSNGTFSVSVDGSDNAGYFKYGVVNFKPAVDVFNGPLYDPITPFKFEFDSVTGVPKDQIPRLLDENSALFESAFVKDKNGLFAGTKPSEQDYLIQDADRVKNNSVRRVFYDPDGMVYRWKEGIATLTLFGDTATTVGNQAPAITDNPFAGQDVMNVLSLLITGEPYNFATFYKAAIQFDNFKRDPSTNEGPSNSYFRGLQAQLKQKNALYGNFIPFKSLTMDEASFSKILGNQLNAIAFDTDLQNLIKERADLGDKFAFIASQVNSPQDQDIQTRLKGFDELIQQKITDISNELSKTENPPITIIGNDISFDSDVSETFGGNKTRMSDDARRELRRKIAFLTRRIAWKVRANEDPSFLMVDDTYDKDYDIQAFEKTFVNPSLFKSEYATVADKIEFVTNILKGMEIFANTQGHIEIRNPKYNRMPSSVFYKMFRMKDQLGIQVFPQFLEDLFSNQLEQLFSQIEVLEDEIRIYCLALGKITDGDCLALIDSFDQNLFAAGGFNLKGNIGEFFFLSDPDTGRISVSLRLLNLSAPPDVLFDQLQQKLSVVQTQTDVNAFSVISRAKFVQSVVPIGSSSNTEQFKSLPTIRSLAGERTREDDLTNRLQLKTGQAFDVSQLFTNKKTVSGADVLQIVNGIAERLSSRQRAVKLAAGALKNIQESVTLFKGGGGVGDDAGVNNLLLPDLYGTNNIPKVFEHMIEDESYDDLGVGSGGRYIIKNRDVISDTISEKRPPWTSIEVTGRLGDLFIKNTELSPDLNVHQQGGNALVTTAAVDYDMWRMYGMSVPQPIDAPYLTNPDTQCPAYAVSLLNTARKQIFGGTVDIVGNEFQQPGEVIYLEHRDLLFYVDSVQHNFTFGQRFSTSLELSFGHNAGEYIPTWLDVIGKILYKNKDISHYVNKRQGNIFNQEHVGTIVGNYLTLSTLLTSTPEDDIVAGPSGDVNRLNLQKIIDYAGQTLSLASDTLTPTLELRVFFNSATGDFSAPSDYALSIASTVRDYLIGTNDLSGNSKPFGSSKPNSNRLSAFKDLIPSPDQIAVDANPSILDDARAPSAKAFGVARDIAKKTSSSSSQQTTQSDVDSAIYNFVVDCWIVFKNPATK
jgi:hypothetical protein